MKRFWQIFVTWVLCVIILWLMAPYLDLEPELAPQEKSMDLVPWRGNCPWVKFRKCHYPAGTLNYSLCHHAVREWNWFDACYKKMFGILMRAKESKIPGSMPWWLDMNSASELGKVWKKLFKGIPRPSVSHFDLYCGTCALVGNSKILWASDIGKNINQHTRVFSRNQTSSQDLVMVGNQTRGRFAYRRAVRGQGSWRQLVPLLLKLSGVVWTSNTLSEEVQPEQQAGSLRFFCETVCLLLFRVSSLEKDAGFEFGSGKQGKWFHLQENDNHTNNSKVILTLHKTNASSVN